MFAKTLTTIYFNKYVEQSITYSNKEPEREVTCSPEVCASRSLTTFPAAPSWVSACAEPHLQPEMGIEELCLLLPQSRSSRGILETRPRCKNIQCSL